MPTVTSLLIALSAVIIASNDEIVHTADGREVILKDNGTWEFTEEHAVTAEREAIISQTFGNIKVSIVSYVEIRAAQRDEFDEYTVMHSDDITVIHALFENISNTEIINIKGTGYQYNEFTGEGFTYNKDFALIDEFDNRLSIAYDGLRLIDDTAENRSVNANEPFAFLNSLNTSTWNHRSQSGIQFRREGQNLRPGETVELRFVFDGRPIDSASRTTFIIPAYVLGVQPQRHRIVIPR